MELPKRGCYICVECQDVADQIHKRQMKTFFLAMTAAFVASAFIYGLTTWYLLMW
jgi:predicted RNA-binding protein YlxR (DUF448 family)